MSKPLTIDELKALQVGDWVWLCGKYENYGEYSRYQKILENSDYCLTFAVGVNRIWFEYSDYGTKWFAYKNKEQAECKGEIVEFPCKLGDTVYFYDFSEKEIICGKVIGIRLNYYTPHNPIWIRVKYDIPMVKEDCDTEVWASMVFADKLQAEARLKELRGEK